MIMSRTRQWLRTCYSVLLGVLASLVVFLLFSQQADTTEALRASSTGSDLVKRTLEGEYLNTRTNRWQSTVTCTVTSTADTNTGTLRWCLSQAEPFTYIDFDSAVFPPTAPETITLLSELPHIITNNLTIDASDAGVILDGSQLTGDEDGLHINGADYVTVRGLQIIGFPDNGIELANGASHAVIGGNRGVGSGPLGQGNLCSGNRNDGILIGDSRTVSNAVLGNFVGTNLSGTLALSNVYGIAIQWGASGNTIGGPSSDESNLLSGNETCGVLLSNNATYNTIIGNMIGTDIHGTSAISNGESGVCVWDGASYNKIGGDQSGERNLISGNGDRGVSMSGSNVVSNVVVGNYIGTDINGTAALPNSEGGVAIFESASNNLVGGNTPEERNLISGNDVAGVALYGAGTLDNRIAGNIIGTDVTGQKAVPNSGPGVEIYGGATSNVVGGGAGEGNLISGNSSYGIDIMGTGTASNTVIGNYIGTDVNGTAIVGNTSSGIVIRAGAFWNIIGGVDPDDRNLISGNGEEGISLWHSGTANNVIIGNFIGTDVSGTAALPNSSSGVGIWDGPANNIIGGDTADAGNLISGNGWSGVIITGTGATSNTVINNYIGTDVSGTQALGNWDGIDLLSGATRNLIKNNLISGNNYEGICLYDVMSNTIVGNHIGTDYSGTTGLGNATLGIDVNGSSESRIEGNLISGNGGFGIWVRGATATGNTIVGNYIGTNIHGTAAISNGSDGIVMGNGASWNTIGGATVAERNLISGNGGDGIAIYNSGTSNNVILGNYIGTDVSGTTVLPNASSGVNIWEGPTHNTIGGDNVKDGNLISGNGESGIEIGSSGTADNIVSNNYIGTDKDGNAPVQNGGNGVRVFCGALRSMIGPGNTVAYNQRGVYVDGSNTLSHTITANSIFSNTDEGILLTNSGNGGITSPVILTATSNLASGTALPNVTVEIFSDAVDEGKIYEGSITSSDTGQWTLVPLGRLAGPYLTATATDAAGNTSEFSKPVLVTGTTTLSWTVMVYLNGDNNLDGQTVRLFNRLELAVANEPALVVRTLWDRSGDGDTVLYDVQPDTRMYALADYKEGQTKWVLGERDMGQPDTLWTFITAAMQDHPSEHYLLALVNHGGGWSPELFSEQRNSGRYAYGGSGFSWDVTNDYNYLSTQDMGGIFSQEALVSAPLDVVFYDACLMGMLEEAYEIRQGVHFLVASENESWSSFPYNDYLAGIEDRTPADQAAWMVDRYYASLPGYPRTMAAINLERTAAMSVALNNLAIKLFASVPTHTAQIRDAFLATQKLDYNYDLAITDTEGYVDLGDFVTKLMDEFPGTGLADAAENVLDVLNGYGSPLVIHERHRGGRAGWSGPYVDLERAAGLSVYLPLGEEDLDLPFYVNSQLALANDTYWDEFIFYFLGEPYPQVIPDSPGGRGTQPCCLFPDRPCCLFPDQWVLLPFVVRDH